MYMYVKNQITSFINLQGLCELQETFPRETNHS